MKVLLTGANGMLGQDLSPALEDIGCLVIETDMDNLDITDGQMVEAVFDEIHPDLVVHCAAYTNVDKAEEDLETALFVNEIGTKNIAKACANIGATLVYISTDYIFDGQKQGAYIPSDAPNPINNYGLSKLKGELAVQEICEKYYIARTSWLYGHHGKNFVETIIGLACQNSDKPPELKVVDDQIGCPTWTVELSNGIIKLLAKPYGIYHVCASGTTSWYGFAKEILEQEGIEVDLKPCTTQEFPRPAKRPANSVMENDKICRNWKVALKDYLNLRKG